jgi:hypothetical protein
VPVQEVERLQRENQKLRWRVEQAELIIDIQKNRRAPWAPPVGPETPAGLRSVCPRGVAVGLLVHSSP